MRSFYLLGLVPLAIGVLSMGDPIVDKHSQTLQKAQSLTIKLTVTPVGGAPEEQTLTFSRPNLLKWEGGDKVLVSDGTTVWTYDKAKKQYTKAAAGNESIIKALNGNDVAWIWSAFFNSSFSDQITSAKKGSSRRLRNAPVTDLAVVRKDNRAFGLFIDDVTGVARGAQYAIDDAGSKKEFIVFAKEMTLGDKTLEASVFAFSPPSDATDAAAAPVANPNGLKYADIKSILDTNCTSCHSGPRPKARVDLSSYKGASGVVSPGNPDKSKMIRVLRNGEMPPTGALAQDQIDKLVQWVKDGAQE